jgi:hypothetical protein
MNIHTKPQTKRHAKLKTFFDSLAKNMLFKEKTSDAYKIEAVLEFDKVSEIFQASHIITQSYTTDNLMKHYHEAIKNSPNFAKM